MSNYDLLEGFIDYTNKEGWMDYIKSYVIPLWKSALILREFFDNLKSEFQNVLISTVAEKDLPLLFGGVIPSREEVYRRNSLAKFYNKFFGLKLSDLQSWVLGGELTGTQLKAIIEETTFVRFVNEIFKWSDRAVRYQTLVGFTEPEVDYKGLKEDPNKLKELVKDFYQSILNVSVNHNYHTFFLWSIKQIPYKFMKEAYPRIDQIIEFLEAEFGLTYLRWKAPFSEGSSLCKDYTIWCWPEYNTQSDRGGLCGPEYSQGKSFGGALSVLNEAIWKHLIKGYSPTDLEKIFTEYFTVFPYLKEEYISRVKDRLAGKIYSYIYYRGITAAEERSRLSETNLTIMQMIDEISPYLFTGLAKIAYIGDDYIQISQV
ncbi:MAG: hypothetical protein QXN53_06110 [Thermoproteota archaeon]